MHTRKFKDGDTVYAKLLKINMHVIAGTECLKGWNYRLAFINKNGNVNKRKTHRFFWENDLDVKKED